MAKYLLLKHYRGAPAPVNNVPMDQWTPDEVDAHIRYMNDFATRLETTGEFVDGQALSPDGMWVRHDGPGRPAVVDGPFAETKDLIAGWMPAVHRSRRRRSVVVTGGIPVTTSDGRTIETRNRVTLCRCGQSANKPLCDGAHKDVGFTDH